MDHSRNDLLAQGNIHIEGASNDFFRVFGIRTLLHQCGMRKHHGYSSGMILGVVFNLAFLGVNFFRGVVVNDHAPIGKDAAYDFLKGVSSNWRRFLLLTAVKIHALFRSLSAEDREPVLIIDDSIYDRSRSKKVELLSRVFDHSTGRYLKGFRMLTLCWSDGVSCLPLDFGLLASSDAKKRCCGASKSMDKRCCAYRRRKEAVQKATDNARAMVKRALNAGVKARYVLMDSWFTMPTMVSALKKHVDVIGMVKKTPNVKYGFDGESLCLKDIYKKLKKRPGRAKILASVQATLKGGLVVKLVFVRDRRKKDWLALLSTDLELEDKEVVRIYGKRWDIEVFFKMAKQHLRLAKEIQIRDYDGLIAHTSIVFLRYMFVAYRCRMETDQRTFGDLFYACCQEMADISFVEALARVFTLTVDHAAKLGALGAKALNELFDGLLTTALQLTGISPSQLKLVNPDPES
ncbi:IS4 family transposase [Desulfatibacillum aliphaticivorans]|uniref:IS4 family transposase n=1 Tax=Desulfatibacillum aliphaticivorans TaxID=218208 RepID=UPI000A05F757